MYHSDENPEAEYYDPIAQKLTQDFAKQYAKYEAKIKLLQDKLFLMQNAQSIQAQDENRLETFHNNFTATHPLAGYETFELLHSDDETSLAFLRTLGLTPETLSKVVVTFEMGEVVQIETTGVAVTDTTVGSPLKYKPKET